MFPLTNITRHMLTVWLYSSVLDLLAVQTSSIMHLLAMQKHTTCACDAAVMHSRAVIIHAEPLPVALNTTP